MIDLITIIALHMLPPCATTCRIWYWHYDWLLTYYQLYSTYRDINAYINLYSDNRNIMLWWLYRRCNHHDICVHIIYHAGDYSYYIVMITLHHIMIGWTLPIYISVIWLFLYIIIILSAYIVAIASHCGKWLYNRIDIIIDRTGVIWYHLWPACGDCDTMRAITQKGARRSVARDRLCVWPASRAYGDCACISYRASGWRQRPVCDCRR